MAGNDRQDLARLVVGRRFWKMSGSGNDFVFVDGRDDGAPGFETAEVIQRICARGMGIGADGVVILTRPCTGTADIGIRYFNSDGSVASLCGNATLCTASLAARLGAVAPAGFVIETGTGALRARIRSGQPEFDLPGIAPAHADWPQIALEPREERLGFVMAAIPHAVIRVPNVAAVDLMRRGRAVRLDPSFAEGANVNFVSRDEGGAWRIRTYERGVEGETLACGTGSVATAILLRLWGEAGGDVELETGSGRVVGISSSEGADGVWTASLRGEGRLVFEGEVGEV